MSEALATVRNQGFEDPERAYQGDFRQIPASRGSPDRPFKMVLPDWDLIRKVEGFPEAGNDLWRFICLCFQEFDRRNHPDVMPAGAWMNSGFSVNHELSPWEIGFKNCSVVYKDEKEVIAA